jgi:energy-coupling factor transport system substrate-specific component
VGAGAGLSAPVFARLGARGEIVGLAVYAWAWGFLYGAIMNLWFWPFQRGGSLSWQPGLGLGATLERYWSFYVATSLGWDAATALANALLVLVLGVPVLRSLRRFAHRLEPAAGFDDAPLSEAFPPPPGPGVVPTR